MKCIWKKLFSVMTAVAMAAGLFTGCGSQEMNGSTDMDTSEPITIDMMLLNNTSGDGSDFVFKIW